ncbi:MAG: hypothetical protein U9R47_06345 [Actinomycetota bacterium]|nr:hypothetical protein [Actinomycetota bacterium]
MTTAAGGSNMRVRFTAEIEYKLRSRGEADPIEYDPGTWAEFTENDVREALEAILRWPELSLVEQSNAGLGQRSKWSPTDVIDESCREDTNGRVVHVNGCDCRNAVIVVDVEIER